MDFRRLEAFSKVYELRSFSRTGEALFLSQPTISAHIASLEKDLGVKLFDRMGRSILPTPAGDVLYRHARQIFASLESASSEIQLLKDQVAGALTVGGSTIPAHYLLPEKLADFIGRHPQVTVQLKVGDSETIVRHINDGSLMVGVVGARYDGHTELEFSPIFEDELVVVAAPGTVDKGGLQSLENLAGLSWVMREKGSGTRLAFERGLQQSDVSLRSLNVSLVVESTQAALRCVKAGLGVTITSRLAADEEISRGDLVVLPCPELNIKRSLYCVFQKQRSMFPALRHFVEFLQQEARGGSTSPKA